MDESQLEERARSRIGSVLRGKYRLDRVLGIGGMAVVYRATHRNQAEFAVKMLHPELSLNQDVCRRFLREGYMANSVKHPGAVAVVDDDVAEDGAAFIVMELLDGVSCEELWMQRGGRLPLDVTCAIALELLDVLASAHQKGIVHRDIKPANLFITRAGVLKVLDFGIARVHESMAGNAQATAAGSLLGTPAFMAPEQALGKTSEIDAKVDIWAVGATIFTLLSGATLHEADNGAQLLVKLATQPPRSIASVVADLPAAIVSVIDAAYAFDRAARWPTATAMRDSLAGAYRNVSGDLVARAVLAAVFGPLAGRDPWSFSTAATTTYATPAASGAAGCAAFAGSDATVRLTSSAAQTSGPVAKDVAPGRATSTGTIMAATFGVVALGAIVGGTILIRSHATGTGNAPSAATNPSAIGDARASAVAPPSVSPLPAEIATATIAGAPSTPGVVASPAPTAVGTRDPKRGQALPRSPPPPPTAPPRAAGSPTPAPARSAVVNCEPPFTFDAAGNRVYKKECL